MDEKRVKTAVLVGGEGEYFTPRYLGGIENMELSAVLTDDPDSMAADRARSAMAPLCPIERDMFPTQHSFDRALFDKLDDLDIDLIIMAEWPYPLPEEILRRWERQILCLYPELRKETAEIRVSACLLEKDGAPGAALLEKTLPVQPGDLPETISRRMAEEAGELLPAAAEMFCSGRLCIHGKQAKMLPSMEE